MDREPDVEITAAVRADQLRFHCKPDVRVVVYSDSPALAELVSERDSLPDPLECGVTYHNVSVRWRAVAWLDDPDVVLATKRGTTRENAEKHR
jgi:hypothetical protein